MVAKKVPLLFAALVSALTAFALSACSSGTAEPIRGPAVALQDDHLALPQEAPEPRIELLAGTGVKVTRFDILWQDVAPTRPQNGADPADPAYDFSHIDRVVKGLQKFGITPIVSVFSAPVWATGGRSDGDRLPEYNSRLPDPAAFGEFMEALSRRYGGRYPGADGKPLPRVRYWELWNEPNLSIFLSPQLDNHGNMVSPAGYARLVRSAYPRVKRGGGPGTVVLVGASGPTSSTYKRNHASAISAADWLEELRRLDVPLDAYSQHIYPSAAPAAQTDLKPSWSTVGDFLAALDRWRPGLDLYITEAGYTTQSTDARPYSFVSEDRQARYLRDIFALPQVKDPRVRVIVWFNMQDNLQWTAGLLRFNGSRKPSYEAFRDVATRPGQRPLTE